MRGIKLLNGNRSLNGKMTYPVGKWVTVPGDGAYLAVSGGLFSARQLGTCFAAFEAREPVDVEELVLGVRCYRRVRRLRRWPRWAAALLAECARAKPRAALEYAAKLLPPALLAECARAAPGAALGYAAALLPPALLAECARAAPGAALEYAAALLPPALLAELERKP